MKEPKMDADTVLKPCPFCGSAHTNISNRYTDNYQVHCMHCGASGPTGARLEIAIAAWNTADRVCQALTAKDAEIAALRERVRKLEAGLRPFVDALEEMRFDRDHRGNPFPDSDPCGWIYVTLGDFRRARALLEPEAGK